MARSVTRYEAMPRRPPRPGAGLPEAQGLYDPQHEHDACGMGFVAHLRGERSARVLKDALTVLANLEHRSAMGGDATTSDGSGVLLQIPHAFLRSACAEIGVALPEAGQYGVGMCFLPRAGRARRAVEVELAHLAHLHGFRVRGWRAVPFALEQVGHIARETRPAIRQVFIAPAGLELDQSDGTTFERTLFIIRRKFEKSRI